MRLLITMMAFLFMFSRRVLSSNFAIVLHVFGKEEGLLDALSNLSTAAIPLGPDSVRGKKSFPVHHECLCVGQSTRGINMGVTQGRRRILGIRDYQGLLEARPPWSLMPSSSFTGWGSSYRSNWRSRGRCGSSCSIGRSLALRHNKSGQILGKGDPTFWRVILAGEPSKGIAVGMFVSSWNGEGLWTLTLPIFFFLLH